MRTKWDLKLGPAIGALAVALSSFSVACLGTGTAPTAPAPRPSLGSLGTEVMAGSLVFAVLLSFLIARALERRVRERTAALQDANRRLEALAHQDDLTQLFNRRYLDACLQTEWQRARRENASVALVLCDVDHFKLYNDAYGHQTGDDCLRQVAQVIRQCLKRPADLATRYGGEEFVIVLPHTDLAGAQIVAEQVRAGLESRGIAHRASPTTPSVTLSLGVASAVPARDQDWRDLIASADRGLYRAKRAGRNRVSAAQPPVLS